MQKVKMGLSAEVRDHSMLVKIVP